MMFTKGGENVKRSEFDDIVKRVSLGEAKRLLADFDKMRFEQKDLKMEHILSFLALQIPEVSSNIAAQIISKSGLVQFDD